MKNKQKIILTIAVIVFILLAIFVICGYTKRIDTQIYKLMVNLQNEKITNILIIITNLGGIVSLFFITLVTVIILIFYKKEKYGIAVGLNIIISSIMYIILKNIFQRPRPEAINSLIYENGYSFPSGHSTNNMAFYAFAIYLICENIKEEKLKKLLCIIFGIIPIVIGFSRIYLGVHYFSDVIGGFCLGIICVILFINYIYKKIVKTKD